MLSVVLLPRQVHKHISTVDVEQRAVENYRNLVDGKRGGHWQAWVEGIVSKRIDAPYRSGPSKSWIKVKNPKAPAATRNLA